MYVLRGHELSGLQFAGLCLASVSCLGVTPVCMSLLITSLIFLDDVGEDAFLKLRLTN